MQQVLIRSAISWSRSSRTEDQAEQRQVLINLKSNKNLQQARENKPSAKLKAENRKGETQIYLSSFVVAEWLACWIDAKLQRSGVRG